MYGGDEGGERGEKRRAVSFEGDRNRILGTVSLGRRLAFFCVVSFFGEEGISTIIRSSRALGKVVLSPMTSPDLSIILPIYNGEAFVAQAIESVLEQTLRSWELILVNDGSTDRTEDICKKYQSEDPRISYIQQGNRGLSAARNAGFVQSKGRYIVYLDADDFVEPDYYHALLSEIQDDTIDFLVTGFIREFHNKGKPPHKTSVTWPKKDLYSIKDIQNASVTASFYNIYIHVWNKIYRRDFLEKHQIRFDESIRYGEDVPYNIEALTYSKHIRFSSLKGYHYICHRFLRLTSTWNNSITDENRRIYNQIRRHERDCWGITSSTVASGMYLRGCFLSMERALNNHLDRQKIYQEIKKIYHCSETKIAVSIIQHQHTTFEFYIYSSLLEIKWPSLIYFSVFLRKALKHLLRR